MKRKNSRYHRQHMMTGRDGSTAGSRPGGGEATALSRDEFATALTKRIHDKDPSLRVNYDPVAFTITLNGNNVMNLMNLYRTYVHPHRSTASDTIEDVARSITRPQAPLPEDFTSAKSCLVPVLRDRLVFDRPGGHIPFSVVVDGLAVSVAYDGPDRMMYLDDATLAQWGTSFDQAYEAAVMNLRIACESRPFKALTTGLHVSEWYDGCDSARLILSDVIRKLPVKGDHVVMAPLRDLLIVTGSEDVDGLGRMLKMAQEVKDDGYLVSLIPVTLTDIGWITCRLAPELPLQRGFEDLYVENMALEYDAQTKRLRESVTKDGVYVPHYLVMRRPDGELCSISRWLEAAENLVPKTDFVSLQGGDGKRLMDERSFLAVPWDQVAAIIGLPMEDAGLYPPRFKVKAQFSDEQLRQLQQIGRIPFKIALHRTGDNNCSEVNQ